MAQEKNEKTASKVLQNLERLYKLATEQELRFPFFKALHAYLDFALKEPKLKRMIESKNHTKNQVRTSRIVPSSFAWAFSVE